MTQIRIQVGVKLELNSNANEEIGVKWPKLVKSDPMWLVGRYEPLGEAQNLV